MYPQSPAAGPSRERRALEALLLAAAVAACWANALRAPFLFDDPRPEAPLFFRTRQLVWASFALNRALSGADTWSYHAFNAAVHLACALALLGVLRRALALALPAAGDRARANVALAVTLLWACHPLQTATVTYLSQRSEAMATLGYLGTLYGFLRSLDSPAPLRWRALALASLAFGFLSKELVATAPLLVLLAEVALVPGPLRASLRARWRFHALLWLLAGALFLAYVGPKLFAEGSSSGFGRHETMGPLDYLRSQPAVILHYLRLAFWPRPLVFDYGWPVARAPGEWLPQALAVGALLAAALWLLARRRPLGFALASFFVVLAPTSSVMPIKDLAFEHRVYLALAPVLLLAALALRAACARLAPRAGGLPVSLAAAAALALAALTVLRNREYRSATALWRTVVERAPANARGYNNLASALIDEADVATDPAVGEARYAEAEPVLARALELAPASSYPHRNLARIAAGRADVEGALAHLARSIELEDSASARADVAFLLRVTDRMQEAEPHLRRALELEPGRPLESLELGRLLVARGEAAEALPHLENAAARGPDSAEERLLLGQALASLGRGDDALAEFRRAARLDPFSVEAREGSARLLLARPSRSAGDLREALDLALEASSLCDPPRADVLETLANAHAALGEGAAAVAALERALELPGPRRSPELAARLRARLAEIRAGAR